MILEIRGTNVNVGAELRERIARRLGFSLGRFDSRLGRVTVVLGDVNGDRGGIDKSCRISARLRPHGEVAAEVVDRHVEGAIDRAAERIGRGVSRAVARRRRRSTSRFRSALGRLTWFRRQLET